MNLRGKFGSSHNLHAVFFNDWAIPQKPTNLKNPSLVPVPIHQIEMMMNVHNPLDATVLSYMDEHEEKPFPVPTDEEIRQWARVSRCEVPGLDNVPPSLNHALPENVFHCVCDIVRAVIRGELRLDILRETIVVPLSRAKEDLLTRSRGGPATGRCGDTHK